MWGKLNNFCKTVLQALAKFVSAYWAVILAIFFVALLVVLIRALVLHLAFGMRWADWVGLGDYTGPLTKDQLGKTLWDWLELLIVPVVLAVAALWFNKSERENEQELATDRQREAALQSYIDKMTELLLDKDTPLRKSHPEDEVRAVGRTRTLATLRMLDSERKGMLVQFLYEAELITKPAAIISLRGADLSEAELSGADLHNVDMSQAYLIKADLQRAYLRGADLHNAILSGAELFLTNLTRANLSGARLYKARLSGAVLFAANLCRANLEQSELSSVNLSRANVSQADLGGADLIDADLTDANLTNANLTGAYLTKTDLTRAKVTVLQMQNVKSRKNATWTDGTRIGLKG